MSYQENTTVNDHKHVIDLLETFLAAQGWTIEATINSTQRELYVAKANGGEVFHFAIKSTGTSSLVINADTAYPSASASGTTFMNLKSSAMVRCWFFVGDLYCYIVVEVASGYYQIGGFGRLAAFDSFPFSTSDLEGAFVLGNDNTAWSSLSSGPAYTGFSLFYSGTRTNHVRHVPTAGVQWGTPQHPMGSPVSYQLFRETYLLVYPGLANANGLRPLMPIRIDVPNNPAVGGGFQNNYPLGYLPNLRAMNFYQVAAASEETIGADVWKYIRAPHCNTDILAISSSYGGARAEVGFAFKQ